MNFSYLASPYSVTDPVSAHRAIVIRDARYRKVCKLAAELMLNGELIYCPIAHSHPIETIGFQGEIKSGDFWLNQDFAVLQHAKELIVFKMDGWDRSSGVAKEIQFAKDLNIPIRYIENKEFKRPYKKKK